jgi:rhodanese-related sulfurtransferase
MTPGLTTTSPASPVTAVRAASPADAHAHFARRLSVETDPADVAAARAAGTVDFVLVDVRAAGAYRKSHLPGALSLPVDDINAEAVAALPDGLIVTYCWGPACNGATRGAAKLSALGRQVKELIGGFEYWVREGQPTEGRRPVDPATAKPQDLGLVC